MTGQILFIFSLIVTIVVFLYTVNRIAGFFRLTKPAFSVKDIGKRFRLMLSVAFGQTKIFRRPVTGFFHALVFWGFCLILLGSIEMVIDGLAGTEKSLKFLGPLHDLIMASGDIFALIVLISVIVFLVRRLFLNIKRFEGIEMKKKSHVDAVISLSLILFLMISLLGMNTGYVKFSEMAGDKIHGIYPVSSFLARTLSGGTPEFYSLIGSVSWWTHILTIFFFANYLPYSKHFHVFMSVPNVFLSRLDPLGKLENMESVTREVRLMINPETAFLDTPQDAPPERFGVKDAEDVTWKNYFDSLSCTECGRCTSVCPANITGKRLSPRKIMMDLRARMKEKGRGMIKHGKEYDDGRSLVRNYITEEELWACTTCNACARECPVNINHPSLIVSMRRYLVMEEGVAPGQIKAMFSNIENNGAPWQYSPDDRLLWSRDIEININ